LSEAIRNPNRSGEIHSLLRNPYHHAVIVPGSAIKGAIRTALLSYFANLVDNSGLRSEVNLEKSHNRSYGREPNLNRAADLLERRILGPESDSVSAMQMLKVSDAEWSPQHVLISKASLEKLSRSSDQTGSMQIHFERLRCQADGAGQPPSCEITIRLNGDALRHPKVPLHRKLDWTTIADACNQFFAGRYNAEQTRFLTILKRSFPHENFPWRPDLRPGDILLRVGHHCHFDSLSVDELREGWNAHTKSPLRDIGNTRTLCELETTGSAPFGWTLLRRIS
jgi:CRISPR-associated protein Csm5